MKIFLLLALFISSISCLANTLVVSDIDDTIKISNVKGPGKLSNAFRTNVIFKGMAKLYKEISSNTNTTFAYVSNAPRGIMTGAHQRILDNGKFPQSGSEYLILRKKRDIIFGSNIPHKIKAIRNLVKTIQPTNLILIGDNGESDIEYYNQIEKEYSNKINIYQFIRVAYYKKAKLKLHQTQFGFVSPIKIALVLNENNLLNNEQTKKFSQMIMSEVVNEVEDNQSNTPKYFPQWIKCNSFKWNINDSLIKSNLLVQFLNKIENRCNINI